MTHSILLLHLTFLNEQHFLPPPLSKETRNIKIPYYFNHNLYLSTIRIYLFIGLSLFLFKIVKNCKTKLKKKEMHNDQTNLLHKDISINFGIVRTQQSL